MNRWFCPNSVECAFYSILLNCTQFCSISSRQPSCPQNWRTNDKGLSTILLTMSILFIVCQSLKLIPDVYELCVCHLTMDKIGHHCTMDWWVSELNQENKKEKNSSLRIFSYLQYIWTFWENTPHWAILLRKNCYSYIEIWKSYFYLRSFYHKGCNWQVKK